MSDAQFEQLAVSINDDLESLATFRQFDDQIGDRLEDAYTIQDLVVLERLERGDKAPVCGYKVALNAKPLMAKFGVTEPVSGHLFADQKHPTSAKLSSADYKVLQIEPEIVAVIGRRIEPRTVAHDRDSVLGAIEKFLPAFELVDARGVSFADVALPSAVAQNMGNAGIVLGGPGMLASKLDVDKLEVIVRFDGETVAQMTGAAPQHPLDAVAWLANHLQLRGKYLEAGMVVLCGSHMPPTAIGSATRIDNDMGELGSVSFTIG